MTEFSYKLLYRIEHPLDVSEKTLPCCITSATSSENIIDRICGYYADNSTIHFIHGHTSYRIGIEELSGNFVINPGVRYIFYYDSIYEVQTIQDTYKQFLHIPAIRILSQLLGTFARYYDFVWDNISRYLYIHHIFPDYKDSLHSNIEEKSMAVLRHVKRRLYTRLYKAFIIEWCNGWHSIKLFEPVLLRSIMEYV